jgi:F0F1-type ATP synthase epsilon subunit
MIEDHTQAADKIAAAKEEQKAAADNGKPSMHIKVYSPFRTYFDQDAYSISGVNGTGPFDILPHHHNFISLLNACELIIKPVLVPPEEQRIRISGGLMHVKSDKVTVFLDI